jgi:methionyl-tRNA formyltransferase
VDNVNRLKTVFMGTPEVAVGFLKLLASKTDVVAVVSQPDRPAGRGLAVTPTPVKAEAGKLGLPVHQPAKPADIADKLKSLKPDLTVVVAYGRLLKADVLSVPRLGSLNVHFSLLPKYRGAAPVQWALVRGETQTGVSLFWLDEGMDTGPIQAQAAQDIGPDDDAGVLMCKLCGVGAQLLDRELDAIAGGRVVRQPQLGEPSLAPLIKREDAAIDLNKDAKSIHDLVRGFRSWPRASLGKELVLKTALAGPSDPPGKGVPGTVLSVERNRGLLVECGSRSRLWFLEVQSEGKKPLAAVDFANGRRLAVGSVLS